MLWRPKVLIINDDRDESIIIENMLHEDHRYTFRLDIVSSVEEAQENLSNKTYHSILLDLSLPGYSSLEALTKLNGEVMATPVIVMTDGDDLRLGYRAVQIGAHDFLVKRGLTSQALISAILFSIERQKRLDDVRNELFTDELTQVFNRRGFITLGQQQLKVSKRFDQPAAVLFVDVDDLKPINDDYGHEYGDIALLKVASALLDTTRDADIVGRMGGDEFAVFMPNTDVIQAEKLKDRIYNAIRGKRIPECDIRLSVSIGASCYEAGKLPNLLAMLASADELMYKAKKEKKE